MKLCWMYAWTNKTTMELVNKYNRQSIENVPINKPYLINYIKRWRGWYSVLTPVFNRPLKWRFRDFIEKFKNDKQST